MLNCGFRAFSADAVATHAYVRARQFFACLTILIAAPLLSCAERTVTAAGVAQVRIEPSAFQVLVGDTVKLSAMLQDADGHELPGRTIAWSSENAAVATVDATGRVVGKSAGTVRIAASAEGVTGNANAQIEPAPIIGIQPSTAAFSANMGGGSPAPISLTIRNEGAGVLDGLSTSVTYGAGEPTGWLVAALSSPRAPSELTLLVSPSGLQPGIYTGHVMIASPDARPRQRSVEVLFEVRAAVPTIRLASTTASFTAVEGQPDPPVQSIAVTNGGQGTLSALGTSVTYASGQPSGWLTANISPTTAPTQLTLAARTGALAPGTYDAMVQVVSGVANNNPQEVKVSLEVRLAPAVIGLSRTTAAVSAIAGGADPGIITVDVTNTGAGTLDGLASSVRYGPGQPTGWLTTTLSSTTAPSTLSLRARIGTLAPGTYDAMIDVASPAATNSPRTIALTFIVSPAVQSPTIALSPGSVGFKATEGGADPGAVSIAVSNAGGGTLGGLSATVGYGAGQPTGWLNATLSATTAPATLTVQATTGTLAVGTYDATISIASAAAPNSPQVATVSFVIDAASRSPVITLSSTSLTFNGTAGSANPASQNVSVTNSGGGTLDGLAAGITYAASQPTGWLTATLDATTAPATLTVQPATGSLAAGTYNATISVTSGVATNSPQSIAISFVVSAAPTPPSIVIAPTSLSFNATAGGASPASKNASVTNGGAGTLNGLAAAITYAAGQPTGWLTANLNATTAPATLTVQPATGSLAAGTYNATVSVTSGVAGNSPQVLAITFVVDPAPVPPAIGLAATAVSFAGTTPGSNPAPKSVAITNSGGGTLTNLAAAVTYASGQPTGWLSASLNMTTAPSTLTLQPTTGSLAAGSYTATVSVSSSVAPNSPRTITVTFDLTTLLPPAAPSDLKAKASGGHIDLTWKDKSTNETSFVVQRSLLSIGLWGDLATLGPNAQSYRDNSPVKGITYYYRVQACNAAGCTVSNVVSEKR